MKNHPRPLPTILASLALALAACGGAGAKTPSEPGSSSGPVDSSPSAEPMSKEQTDTLAAVEAFLSDPQNADPEPITRYMNDSPDVMVVIEQELTGDDKATMTEEESALLLVGFIAGNIKAQILRGRKENDPVGGVRGMLAVYAALQASSPSLSSPKLDDFAKHEAAGTLEEHVEKISSR